MALKSLSTNQLLFQNTRNDGELTSWDPEESVRPVQIKLLFTTGIGVVGCCDQWRRAGVRRGQEVTCEGMVSAHQEECTAQQVLLST